MITRKNTLAAGILSLLAAATLVTSCAPPPPAGLSETDRATITASEEAWQAAANARDWAALAALYSEDAVMMPPNLPVVTGRAGIEELHAATPEGADLQLTVAEIDGSGDLAYVRGTWTMSVPMGETTWSDSGNYLEVRRKAADGSWPIVLDIYNSDTPLPEAEM